MFNTSLICTVLILLSVSRIITSIPVTDDYSDIISTSTSTITHTSPAHEDLTTELQNVLVCETTYQQAECIAFLEAHINKDSKEYRQLNILKDISSSVLPIPVQATLLVFTDLIQVLLRNGLPINKKYFSLEETMLHFAAEQGQDKLITLLLTEGADIEVKNNHGNTPLHEAVSWFKSTTVKLLLDTGADVNVTNKIGETPLFLAVKNLSPEEYKYVAFIGEVVAEYMNENYPAAKNIIKFLLEHGANANIANDLGNTPLHVAAKNSNLTIVQLLINGGANINATDVNNQTPLHKATESNNVPVVEYLISIGADKTITDTDQKTALDIAKEKNFTEIVDLLTRETFYHVVSLCP